MSIKGRQFIDQKFVDLINNKGIRLFVWTINDPDRIKHHAHFVVAGVITDNPAAGNYIEQGRVDQ